MFCKFCGTSIDHDSEFCKHCGKKQITVNGNTNNIPITNKPMDPTLTSDKPFSSTPTAPKKRCQVCGKIMTNHSIIPICEQCQTFQKSVSRKSITEKRNHTPLIVLLLVVAIIIIIIFFANKMQEPDNDYTYMDSISDSSSSSSSSENFPEPTEYEIKLGEVYSQVHFTIPDIVKEELKNPDTANFTAHRRKFSSQKSKFTYFGSVTYVNSKNVKVTEPFEVCVLITDAYYYNSLYLKLGDNVLYDHRNYTDDYGNLTSVGAQAQGKSKGMPFFDKDHGQVICIDMEPSFSTSYPEEPTTQPSSEYASKNDPKMTYEEYTRIENNMTYEEVCDIVGSYGVELSRASFGGYEVVMVSWDGNGTIGANANVTFQNGRVYAKAQLGLR